MEVRLIHSARLPRWPAWTLVLLAAWTVFQAGVLLLSGYMDRPIVTCLFKLVTSLPCPTCGTTRGLAAIANGQIGRAFGFNPLVFTATFGFACILATRVIFARNIQLVLVKRERRLALAVAIVLVLINWGYVIAFVG